MPSTEIDVDSLRNGDRRTLARAITLTESSRADDRLAAGRLLDDILPFSGDSIRLAVSGTPGVGKSTFIESFGLKAIERGHRLAVLSIDPTSARTGGSILGDKTRMPELSRSDAAFVRPSPSGGHLGGVGRRTREAILVCEAAGHDIVIVETVGVGQSETTASEMTDHFLLLLAPGGGDDLQGIKRGIMELADIVAVNKSDGELLDLANHTVADHRAALHLVRPKWPDLPTEVRAVSARTGSGIVELLDLILERDRILEDRGWKAEQRRRQAVAAFRSDVESGLVRRAFGSREANSRMERLEQAVADGEQSAASAAAAWLSKLD
jgi:LAO/AO transport system kinase